jgi:8-oxo-dGTP pyrophosphatase MutT (NUDIX family)
LNRHGEILIQKRTPAKDIYPGYWDLAAGGVVLKGENYGKAAARELYEELGIRSNDLTFQFDQYYEDENNRVWGRVYTCHHEGPFTLQKEEIEKALFVSFEKIFQLHKTEPFTPDSIPILKKLLSKK